MRFPRRDWFATAMVALATLMAVLWAVDATLPGLEGVRATGVVVMVCGFVASAGAVVPGFDGLIHGNRIYLVVASLLGLVALGAGIGLLVSAESWWLAVLVAATVVLWAMATIRHSRSAFGRQPAPVRLEERPRQPIAL
jgi:hypothetical protein